jgi:hypothetical protein
MGGNDEVHGEIVCNTRVFSEGRMHKQPMLNALVANLSLLVCPLWGFWLKEQQICLLTCMQLLALIKLTIPHTRPPHAGVLR